MGREKAGIYPLPRLGVVTGAHPCRWAAQSQAPVPMRDAPGIDPGTSRTATRRSYQLSYPAPHLAVCSLLFAAVILLTLIYV